jgi:hypothetical protein
MRPRRACLPLAGLLAGACADDRGSAWTGATGVSDDAGSDETGESGDGDDSGDADSGPGDSGPGDSGPGTSDGDGDSGDDDTGDGASCESWQDPFPPLPAENDAAFPPGDTWHVGPNGVEYQLRIPMDAADTAELPLVLTADVYNGGLRFENVIALYFPVEQGGHNSWIDDEFWNCWPGCSVFTFLGVDGTRALLLDLGTRLRFAHDRVFMDGVGEGREEVTIGLDPQLQPFFAGVVHYYAEWQMAVCPQVAGFAPDGCAPRVFFGMAGCDHSYCPSQSCYETVAAAGFSVERLVGYDVQNCPCPLQDLNDVPHLLPMPDFVREAHVDFVKTTTK